MGELIVGRVEPIRNSLASDVPVYKIEDRFLKWITEEIRFAKELFDKESKNIDPVHPNSTAVFYRMWGHISGLEQAQIMYLKMK